MPHEPEEADLTNDRNLIAWEEFQRGHMLRKPEKDAIESLAWAMRHFGSLCTGRQCRRSTVLSLVAMGIAESIGRVAVCDDDGSFVEPERYREGFRLTPFGLRVHSVILQDYRRKDSLRKS